jgi:PilZ domain
MERERWHHRFPIPGARLRGPTFDAPVINLSRGGLAIRTDREFAPGDRYSAWLETDSDRSRVEGWVAWRRPVPADGGAEGRSKLLPLFDVGLSVERIRKVRGATRRAVQPEGQRAEPAPSSSPTANVSGPTRRSR